MDSLESLSLTKTRGSEILVASVIVGILLFTDAFLKSSFSALEVLQCRLRLLARLMREGQRVSNVFCSAKGGNRIVFSVVELRERFISWILHSSAVYQSSGFIRNAEWVLDSQKIVRIYVKRSNSPQ
jgi:hypothetical protein